MEEHAQVVSFDPQATAKLVAVANFIFKKDLAQDLAVTFGKLVEDSLYVLLGLGGNEGTVQIGAAIGRVDEAAVELIVPGVRAEELAHHVVANRIHEGTEAIGLFQAAILAKGDEDAREGLLLNFLDGIAGKQTRDAA